MARQYTWWSFFQKRTHSLFSRFLVAASILTVAASILVAIYVILARSNTGIWPSLDLLGGVSIAMGIGIVAILVIVFGISFLVLFLMSSFSKGRHQLETSHLFPLSLEDKVSGLETRVDGIENGLSDVATSLKSIEVKLKIIEDRLSKIEKRVGES